MADFRVSISRLKSDAELVETYIGNMKNKMQNIKNDLAELDAMWDGQASETFKKAFNDDVEALSTLISNLNKLYAYETLAYEKYESYESQVSGVVSGL